ncbi:MAG TPA: ATP-dependent Clp protease proteolytic subunit, partial [Longimicrobiaceae bacterium]
MQRYRSRTGGRPLRAFAAFVPLAALLGLGIGGALAQEEAPPSEGLVYRIPVTGVVELGLAPFISRSLDEAAEAGAVAAVLDIDTPGGRVDAAQQIADALGDARIPVYAYVNRRALSAGALIALATDRIYMRPGSSLGAATPVTGEGEKASEKMVSAMRSEFRALAEAAGLDPAGKLLTLSTADAVRIGYAQEVADWDALLATIGATGAAAVDTRPNWAEGIVRFLTHPLVSPFLLSLG